MTPRIRPLEAYPVRLRFVMDPKTGRTQLVDIFIHGIWVGSRRTVSYCMQEAKNHGFTEDDVA